MDDKRLSEIQIRLKRYVGEYGWKWNFVRQSINGFFGTDYTVEQLKRLYKSIKYQRQG